MGHCLHEEIGEISALLAGSIRVSRRATRQGGLTGLTGLTQLDYRFHVNAYRHLTAKGLPAAVIQLGLKSNPGSCKEAFTQTSSADYDKLCRLDVLGLEDSSTGDQG